MKKLIIALVLIMTLGFTAFAGGLLDIGFSPIHNEALSIGVGYRVDHWSFVAKKPDFSTWKGLWSIGFFWENGGYKIGPVIELKWIAPDPDATPAIVGGIVYKNMMIVVGYNWTLTLGDVLNPTTYVQLGFSANNVIVPEVGFELEFDMFDKAEELGLVGI